MTRRRFLKLSGRERKYDDVDCGHFGVEQGGVATCVPRGTCLVRQRCTAPKWPQPFRAGCSALLRYVAAHRRWANIASSRRLAEAAHYTPSRQPYLRSRPLSGYAGVLGLVASYPLFIERYVILTNTYRIAVPNLPKVFSGLRLVQLTDLHYGFLVPLSVIRHVVARANRIKRDLVVCTGDYVHEKNATGQIDTVWPVLAQLTAPLGVLSVLGNHDHWADTEKSQHWLSRTGQDLRHKAIPLERKGKRIWIAGAGDLWEDHRGLDDLLRDIPDSECRIVLAHNPDSADTKFTSRIDLMVSGHTHGGQVNIPFVGAPLLPVRNKNYSSGLKQSPKGAKVFICRGIGWAVYPIRFNCFPEIAVLELVPDLTISKY